MERMPLLDEYHFRLLSLELEEKFVREAAENGLIGLKGHCSVGGLRASLYNAMTSKALALANFMREFRRKQLTGFDRFWGRTRDKPFLTRHDLPAETGLICGPDRGSIPPTNCRVWR